MPEEGNKQTPKFEAFISLPGDLEFFEGEGAYQYVLENRFGTDTHIDVIEEIMKMLDDFIGMEVRVNVLIEATNEMEIQSLVDAREEFKGKQEELFKQKQIGFTQPFAERREAEMREFNRLADRDNYPEDSYWRFWHRGGA